MPEHFPLSDIKRSLQSQPQLRPAATRNYAARPPNMSKAKGSTTPPKTTQASNTGPKDTHPSPRQSARPTPTTTATPATTMPKALPFKPTTSSSSAPTAAAAAVPPPQALARSRAKELAGALRSPNRARPVILAVGGAAIIALGSWYGVGLKMAKEERDALAAQAKAKAATSDFEHETSLSGTDVKGVDAKADAKERKKMDEARAERIYQLEGARGRLVYARDDLQRKIEAVDERARVREGKVAAAAGKVEERAEG